ncbi:ABC transporter permease [Hippea jasoniae]|uniref:ABC transporter permease n=1 Tax=Hippea jasoniae TaxID=944479 RepID=UPI00055002A2|nr:ABC transporter permease subunit [Hippea jasoniae]
MQKFKGINRVLGYILATFIIVTLWNVLSLILSTPAFPEVGFVFHALVAHSREVFKNMEYSLFRVIAALMLALGSGVFFGLLSFSKKMDKVLSPFLFILYPIPHIVLLPLFLILFGIGDTSKILLIAFICFFQIWMAVRDGAARIEQNYIYTLKSMNATKKDIYVHLVFPYILPYLFTGLKISVGTSIAVLFFVESFATSRGLGFMIMDAWSAVNYPLLYAAMSAMAFMGFAFYIIVEILNIWLCGWIYKTRT